MTFVRRAGCCSAAGRAPAAARAAASARVSGVRAMFGPPRPWVRLGKPCRERCARSVRPSVYHMRRLGGRGRFIRKQRVLHTIVASRRRWRRRRRWRNGRLGPHRDTVTPAPMTLASVPGCVSGPPTPSQAISQQSFTTRHLHRLFFVTLLRLSLCGRTAVERTERSEPGFLPSPESKTMPNTKYLGREAYKFAGDFALGKIIPGLGGFGAGLSAVTARMKTEGLQQL